MAMKNQTFKECFTIDLGKREPDIGIKGYIKHFFFDSGYVAVVCYRLGRYFLLKKFAPFNKGIPFISIILTRFGIALCGCEINYYAEIDEGFCLAHSPGVVIGARVKIGKNVTIYSGVTLGAKVKVTDPCKKKESNRFPTIGDDVTIYTGAKVLGSIVVGKGAVIGANSVLLSSVPAGRTAVGIPARILPISAEKLRGQ
jgi:serine O-acetyltransferase